MRGLRLFRLFDRRLSASTDLRSASMMLITLLGFSVSVSVGFWLWSAYAAFLGLDEIKEVFLNRIGNHLAVPVPGLRLDEFAN